LTPQLGFQIGVHALRATAATTRSISRHRQGAGVARARHPTRIYDHRRTRPEDSPTFKVAY
jgi:integrase/recombinase XerD